MSWVIRSAAIMTLLASFAALATGDRERAGDEAFQCLVLAVLADLRDRTAPKVSP